jgi:2-aminobenzoate-CoA ligase
VHPGVADFSVLGLADDVTGMIVPAFAVLKPGHGADPALAQARLNLVNQAVAPCKGLRENDLRSSLSRAETGKLQRFDLKAGA